MKKTLLMLVLVFLVTNTLKGHPWKPNHYVIIDTDGGIDDFRAIVMLLASADIRVLGITTSNGVIDAKEAFKKVKSLMVDLHHEGIPVAINYSNSKPKIVSLQLNFNGAIIIPFRIAFHQQLI
jgi:hypothetical protein